MSKFEIRSVKKNFCFAAEKMLGRLAKWLRILGFDTWYEQDSGFEMGAAEPDRIVLTRRSGRRQLRPGRPHVVVIHSDHYMDQLAELIDATGMTLESVKPFSRCIRCNHPIVAVAKAAVRGAVPDYVWDTHDAFKTCVNCRRIYWRGSHIEHTFERIRELFKQGEAEGSRS
jgi:uncharacterized protein with PIN domain